MDTVVIYDSKFGNTERVAQAIARGAGSGGPVRVVAVAEAAPTLAGRPDLVLVGGPTQRRGMSPGLRDLVDLLAPVVAPGVPVAAFDTRYRGATLFLGSAAAEADRRLRAAGAQPAAPPESFFISRKGPLELQVLEPGELERAEAWGRTVVAARPARPVAPAAGPGHNEPPRRAER